MTVYGYSRDIPTTPDDATVGAADPSAPLPNQRVAPEEGAGLWADPEPDQAEPYVAGSSDPAWSEPAWSEPAWSEPAWSEPGSSEPAWSDLAGTVGAVSEPSVSELASPVAADDLWTSHATTDTPGLEVAPPATAPSPAPFQPIPRPSGTDALVLPPGVDELLARIAEPWGDTDAADAPDVGTDVAGPPEITPWDRRPLMIALAATTALVLIGVLSGMASASYFDRGGPTWRAATAGAPATPEPTSSAAPGTPVGAEDTITLSGVGDVIMGTLPNKLPPNGGKGFFDPVKSALDADLVMGNLETALSQDTGYSKCSATAINCFQFHLDGAYANYLADGGFDLVSLANNHTNDMGPAGLRNTRAALEKASIKHTGSRGQITYVDVKGVKVAVLGFSPFSASDRNMLNIPAAQELVRRADVEADLVVIQMQGGAEGAGESHVRPGTEWFNKVVPPENRGDMVKFAHAVIDAGADVIFGHGPHIMRGMEFYKGRLIAYSLGNFCGYGVLNSAGFLGVGGVLRVTLKKDGSWAGGTLIATEMVKGGMVALDSDKRALGFVNGLSKSDFDARAASIDGATGQITPPTS